jgi:hypothetical protein
MATPGHGGADPALAVDSTTAAARADAPSPRAGSPTGAFLGRLMLVHFVAWAVGFGSAVAQMPIAIWARQKELLHAGPTGATVGLVKDAAHNLALSPTESAQLQIVLGFIMWGGLTILLAVHIAGLPWCIGAARATRRPELAPAARKGLRIFGFACATIGVVVVLAGVAGWIWLYTL